MSSITITNVSAHGCDCCADVKRMLDDEIKPQYPDVVIEHVDMLSERGQKLVQKHQFTRSPGILVNGKLIGSGDVTKENIIQAIEEVQPDNR